VIGWLATRKGASCRPGSDPEVKRYRATKLRLRLGVRVALPGFFV